MSSMRTAGSCSRPPACSNWSRSPSRCGAATTTASTAPWSGGRTSFARRRRSRITGSSSCERLRHHRRGADRARGCVPHRGRAVEAQAVIEYRFDGERILVEYLPCTRSDLWAVFECDGELDEQPVTWLLSTPVIGWEVYLALAPLEDGEEKEESRLTLPVCAPVDPGFGGFLSPDTDLGRGHISSFGPPARSPLYVVQSASPPVLGWRPRVLA